MFEFDTVVGGNFRKPLAHPVIPDTLTTHAAAAAVYPPAKALAACSG